VQRQEPQPAQQQQVLQRALQLVRAQDRIAHPRVKFEATAISL